MSTAIVTDSTSDIPPKLREDLGIFQIPVDLTLEDKTYLDGFDLSRNDFYDRLPSLKKMPTTAAPASADSSSSMKIFSITDTLQSSPSMQPAL